MRLHVRLTHKLEARVRADLRRRHAHAMERVGFLFGRSAPGPEDERVLVLAGYMGLDDDEYIADSSAGAVYSAGAIRRVRQRVLDSGESAFHVHIHEHRGTPAFSPIDLGSLREVIPSIRILAPEAPHGALLMSNDEIMAIAWCGNAGPSPVESVSVVGSKIQTWRHEW